MLTFVADAMILIACQYNLISAVCSHRRLFWSDLC